MCAKCLTKDIYIHFEHQQIGEQTSRHVKRNELAIINNPMPNGTQIHFDGYHFLGRNETKPERQREREKGWAMPRKLQRNRNEFNQKTIEQVHNPNESVTKNYPVIEHDIWLWIWKLVRYNWASEREKKWKKPHISYRSHFFRTESLQIQYSVIIVSKNYNTNVIRIGKYNLYRLDGNIIFSSKNWPNILNKNWPD